MEAPDKIWALCDRRKHWQESPPQDGQKPWHWTEYTRTDAVMLDPSVKALIEALEFYAAWENEEPEPPTEDELMLFDGVLDFPTPKAMLDRGEKARATLAAIKENNS